MKPYYCGQKEKDLRLVKNAIIKMCLEIIYLIYEYKGFGIKWSTMVVMLWNLTIQIQKEKKLWKEGRLKRYGHNNNQY